MRKKTNADLFLKRTRGPKSVIFLCATLATSLAIIFPGSAAADSKLRAVVDDLLKQQAELELTQAALTQQITALELNQNLLMQRLTAAEQKQEAKAAQLAALEEELEQRRKKAGERFITSTIIAAILAQEAGSSWIPPSGATIDNARFVIGDTLWEAFQTGDYTFIDTFVSVIVDSDGDGIPDHIDFCPETYGTLLFWGCAAQ